METAVPSLAIVSFQIGVCLFTLRVDTIYGRAMPSREAIMKSQLKSQFIIFSNGFLDLSAKLLVGYMVIV